MRTKHAISSLALGTLMLGGLVVALPSTGSAQDATPGTGTSQEMEDSNPNAIAGDPTFNPTVDLATAQETALKDQTGASVLAVDLNGEDGTLVYDVSLDNGYEIRVDATSGEILATEEGNVEDGNNDDDQNGDDQNDEQNDDNHDDGEEQDD